MAMYFGTKIIGAGSIAATKITLTASNNSLALAGLQPWLSKTGEIRWYMRSVRSAAREAGRDPMRPPINRDAKIWLDMYSGAWRASKIDRDQVQKIVTMIESKVEFSEKYDDEQRCKSA